jgi:PTH1 family peptidyl-tRNA hydrolase
MVVGRLASRHGVDLKTKKFKSFLGSGTIAGRSATLLMPQTFMNLSGEAVQPAAAFYQVEPSSMLVLHDELDVAFGELRFKQAGGHAGHNGLRSIIAQLGTPGFDRVRIGIGRPQRGDVTGHVLGRFSPEERAELDDVLERVCDAVELYLSDGLAAAQLKYHTTK